MMRFLNLKFKLGQKSGFINVSVALNIENSYYYSITIIYNNKYSSVQDLFNILMTQRIY